MARGVAGKFAAVNSDATRDVPAYLDRIGFDRDVDVDLATLTALQLAHLQAVPFEALEVFQGRRIECSDDWAWTKIVERGRGGWCFECNGAFALLLDALGFNVRRLGAAVLLDGPNTVIDHLVLEVELDEPYLVEVGFGDNAPVTPLRLDQRGPQVTPGGTFEFLASPDGHTLAQIVDGVPEARYRFRRMSRELAEFVPASDLLQSDDTNHWRTKPFATRLVAPDHRITLTRDTFKSTHGDTVQITPVAPGEWNQILADEFGIDDPIDVSDW